MNQPPRMSRASTFPGDRSTLVQWGIDAAQANGVDLSPFRSVLVVQNYGVDHGAAGNGVVIVHQDPALCEFGFICHEMGHGFDLPHSLAANPDFEYGDGWDVMSFATTTPQFPIAFQGTNGRRDGRPQRPQPRGARRGAPRDGAGRACRPGLQRRGSRSIR